MNPCRCGHADDPGYACARGSNARCAAQYQNRLSGPLLDQFDLTIDVPSVSAADLLRPAPAEGSSEVAARVAAARALQRERYRELGLDHVGSNAAAPASIVATAPWPSTPGAGPAGTWPGSGGACGSSASSAACPQNAGPPWGGRP